MTVMRTSYSAIETYKLCPQKYKFQELDRIPAKKSKAALFGTHIHATLKYMFSHDPLFPTLDEVLHYFREYFPAQEKMDLAPEERPLYLAEGERMLKTFYAKNAPWNFSVVDLESRFEVLIDDPRRGETHVLAGRIDRIDKTEDGYEVIDYKTSRRMPSQRDVDENLQLSLYALGLSRRWPHLEPDAIRLSLYFVKHGEKLSTRRTEEAMAETVHDVLDTVTEIQGQIASGGFHPVPGPHCSFCPYRNICPAWRHLYRNETSGIKSQEKVDAAIAEYFELLKTTRGNAARLAELKATIAAYMEAEGFERVFGEGGYLARSRQQRFGYDFEKVRAILEPLGKWEEVLTADEKKLAALVQTLPPDIQRTIASARMLVREFSVITASIKRIRRPDGPTPLPPAAVPDADVASQSSSSE